MIGFGEKIASIWKKIQPGKQITLTVLATPYQEGGRGKYEGSLEQAVDNENRIRYAKEAHIESIEAIRVKASKAALRAENERIIRASQPRSFKLTPGESKRVERAKYLGDNAVLRVMDKIAAEHNAGLSK